MNINALLVQWWESERRTLLYSCMGGTWET